MAESPIFVKTEQFLLWLLPHTAKFPQRFRYSLTFELEREALRFQGDLIGCAKGEPATQRQWLKRADVRLTRLKHLWRLARPLASLGESTYEHGSRLLDELGRLLGGWLGAER